MARTNVKNYRKVGNKWQVSIRQQGKMIYRTFKTEPEAQEFVLNTKKSIAHLSANPQDRSLRNVLFQYLQAPKTQKLKSIDTITSRVNKLVRDFEDLTDLPIGSITVKDLDDFKHNLEYHKLSVEEIKELKNKEISIDSKQELEKKKLSKASLNQYFSLLNQAYEYGITRLGMPIINITSRVEKEVLNNARDRILSSDEHERLKKTLQDWMKPIVEIALETACRQGEIRKIQLKHINFKERQITLIDTKNGTNRTVPLSKNALKVLKEEYDKLTDEQKQNIETFLFKGTKNSISSSFAESCKKANIQDITFHDLRHTAITLNLAPYIPNVLMLAKITGHKTISQLQRYYNPTNKTILDMLDQRK